MVNTYMYGSVDIVEVVVHVVSKTILYDNLSLSQPWLPSALGGIKGQVVNFRNNSVVNIFMPPTLEKLKGQFAFGLSVRPSVRPCVRYKNY